jgi:hypothetical protein
VAVQFASIAKAAIPHRGTILRYQLPLNFTFQISNFRFQIREPTTHNSGLRIESSFVTRNLEFRLFQSQFANHPIINGGVKPPDTSPAKIRIGSSLCERARASTLGGHGFSHVE